MGGKHKGLTRQVGKFFLSVGQQLWQSYPAPGEGQRQVRRHLRALVAEAPGWIEGAEQGQMQPHRLRTSHRQVQRRAVRKKARAADLHPHGRLSLGHRPRHFAR